MAPDVVGETGFGVDSLIEDYHRLADYLPNFETTIERLEPIGDTMFATTKVRLVLSAATLQRTFPLLAPSEKQNDGSPFATTLLGEQLVTHGSTQFRWCNSTKRVKLLQFSVDLLTPMLQLLGDLRIVSCVFDKSLITSDCRLAGVSISDLP
ncbi:hypothetical protein PPTG_00281 [Phytophthora nicotianae INRA-310]|uniref:Uncharacterized protein n=3 Tax=Phytophthora nicotianae TaxID=4792 RepID=W2REE1_PHYN3|nr:hypothetical protein PPTG_00281 [Phytophthora nicotianae INRA-310]ETN23752.1 hypothetical protein PPTG_00281 [Phytophthora nicotianae INRA-310]ETO86075.1 hypothetical protein F444_00344 [Phytophthora nicotianae P1976]